MIEKQCSNCGIVKPISEYFRETRRKAGYAYHCKDCRKAATNRWRKTHKKEMAAYSHARWERDKDSINEKARKKRAENPEKDREKYRKSNAKRLGTPKGKIGNSLRKRIHLSLRGNKGGRRWESLVGYTCEELKIHLESKFLPGMSWENMGQWHIDHIIPISAFHYETPEDIDFARCWSLNNLRPLWASDNFKKKDSIQFPHQPSLPISLNRRILNNGQVA